MEREPQSRQKKTVGEINKWLNKIKGEDYPWFYEITKIDPEDAIMDLQKAFNNYYKNKAQFGFPNFKAKKREPMWFGVSNDGFSIDRYKLKIQKMGCTVNMTEEVRSQGRLLSCRI